MNKEVSNIEKAINDLLLSKEIFIEKPSKEKIWIYSIIYLLLTYFGIRFDFWYISGIFSVFFILFSLADGGFKIFIPLSVGGILISYFTSNIMVAAFNAVHIIIALMIYLLIINRLSKVTIILCITAFLFLVSSIFFTLLLKTGYLNITPQGAGDYINNYVMNEFMQKSMDAEILKQSFEQLKQTFPSIIFSFSFIYTVILVQYTISSLAKEKAIIPVFGSLRLITVKKSYATLYLLLSFITYLIQLNIDNDYNMVVLILVNFLTIFKWLFVFNGIFTFVYFMHQNKKNVSILEKILLLAAVFILNFLFEVIGIVDSIFSLRRKYSDYMGGK